MIYGIDDVACVRMRWQLGVGSSDFRARTRNRRKQIAIAMETKVKIVVIEKGPDAIIGVVLLAGKVLCFTLMAPEHYLGMGTYHCVLEYSPKFKRDLYEIKDHPTMTECKFHIGNTRKDTEGCPLLGMSVGYLAVDMNNPLRAVLESRAAFGLFMTELQRAQVKQFNLQVVEFV
jgi:hypothetical protein